MKINEQLRMEVYRLKSQIPIRNGNDLYEKYTLQESLHKELGTITNTRNYDIQKKYQTLDYSPKRDEILNSKQSDANKTQIFEKEIESLRAKKKELENEYKKLLNKGAKTTAQKKLKSKLEVDIEAISNEISAIHK